MASVHVLWGINSDKKMYLSSPSQNQHNSGIGDYVFFKVITTLTLYTEFTHQHKQGLKNCFNWTYFTLLTSKTSCSIKTILQVWNYLSITFYKTARNMVFICCCCCRSTSKTCCWPSCSFSFSQSSCFRTSRSASAFSLKNSTSGYALLWPDLRRFGDPYFRDFRFFVSLKFSIAFFGMSSAVSLSFSCCLEAESASAVAVSSLETNSLRRFFYCQIIPLPFSSS